MKIWILHERDNAGGKANDHFDSSQYKFSGGNTNKKLQLLIKRREPPEKMLGTIYMCVALVNNDPMNETHLRINHFFKSETS